MYHMSSTEYISIASILIASSAVAVSLLRFRKDKVKAQADLVSALAALVRHIDNERAIEARGVLRTDPVLNSLNGKELDNQTVERIDEKTQEAARYIATTSRLKRKSSAGTATSLQTCGA
jgi:hypothetical protein